MEKVENRKIYTQEQFYKIVHREQKIYTKEELKKAKDNFIKFVKKSKTYFS